MRRIGAPVNLEAQRGARRSQLAARPSWLKQRSCWRPAETKPGESGESLASFIWPVRAEQMQLPARKRALASMRVCNRRCKRRRNGAAAATVSASSVGAGCEFVAAANNELLTWPTCWQLRAAGRANQGAHFPSCHLSLGRRSLGLSIKVCLAEESRLAPTMRKWSRAAPARRERSLDCQRAPTRSLEDSLKSSRVGRTRRAARGSSESSSAASWTDGGTRSPDSRRLAPTRLSRGHRSG